MEQINPLVKDITLKGENGNERPVDDETYNEIYSSFLINRYIDTKGNITPNLKEDIANNVLKIPEGFESFANDYTKVIKNLFTDTKIEIGNELKKNINEFKSTLISSEEHNKLIKQKKSKEAELE